MGFAALADFYTQRMDPAAVDTAAEEVVEADRRSGGDSRREVPTQLFGVSSARSGSVWRGGFAGCLDPACLAALPVERQGVVHDVVVDRTALEVVSVLVDSPGDSQLEARCPLAEAAIDSRIAAEADMHRTEAEPDSHTRGRHLVHLAAAFRAEPARR